MKIYTKQIYFLGLVLLLIMLSATWASASSTKSDLDPVNGVTTSIKMTHYNKKALRRLDFYVKGKSCAVCLARIEKRIKLLNGTVQVAVMLKKPYGASVIYDASKISEEKLLDTAKFNEPAIKLLDIQDTAIDQIPIILIPPHNETTVLENGSPSSAIH